MRGVRRVAYLIVVVLNVKAASYNTKITSITDGLLILTIYSTPSAIVDVFVLYGYYLEQVDPAELAPAECPAELAPAEFVAPAELQAEVAPVLQSEIIFIVHTKNTYLCLSLSNQTKTFSNCAGILGSKQTMYVPAAHESPPQLPF